MKPMDMLCRLLLVNVSASPRAARAAALAEAHKVLAEGSTLTKRGRSHAGSSFPLDNLSQQGLRLDIHRSRPRRSDSVARVSSRASPTSLRLVEHVGGWADRSVGGVFRSR